MIVSYTSGMTLQGTEADKFNVPAVGVRLESTRGIKLSPTADTFSGIGNATGATVALYHTSTYILTYC